MLNLKKTAVAVLAFGSSAVFAGAMGPVCSAVNVTVPCESTAWDFGGKALYLQPAFSNGVGSEVTLTTANGNGASLGRNPQWSWGFMIEGSYHFNTGNDLNLNWYHINRSTTRTVAAAGPFTASVPTILDITATSGAGSFSVDPKWDAVNLEFGQHVDFGENKSIRFHGGAQYARLTGNTSIVGSGDFTGTLFDTLPISLPYTYGLTSNPTYNGFGPRMGADMSYDWGNGLGIYANGAGAILAGSSKFTNILAVNGTNLITTNGSSTVIVPELEAKLGATYTYAMAQGDLTLDAGWMWVNYFSVINADLIGGNKSDFGLQGPYIGLKWLGNVA